ncbi:hypothetical protein AOLI_G00319270 [Acnodon oligacanthus]
MSIAVALISPTYDPCNKYTSLDQPWRANNESGSGICDRNFNWNGWYRLFYYGMNIRMPETCVNVSGCGTDYPLWLSGPHPETEDGVVTRQVCGNQGNDCCYYKPIPIRVKACPGSYYVYEFVSPASCKMAHCTDAHTITPASPTEVNDVQSKITMIPTTNNSTFDPCNNYSVLDNYWRSIKSYYDGHDDTLVEWSGWYRLYLQGPEDGIVTREVYGSNGSQCTAYRSKPIQVKACPGDNYVYKFVKPDVSIPMPSYCAAPDPCNNYTVLNDSWRTTYRSYGYESYDDMIVSLNGWYRLYLQGKSAQLSEACLGYISCGGYTPLMLNESHPLIRDGIVTRHIYGAYYTECRYYKSNPIQVKACPGHYYVYKLVKPNVSIPMPTYCAAAFDRPTYDPCNNYTFLDQPWRATNAIGLKIYDTHFTWNGWYRMFNYGRDIRMAESCVNVALITLCGSMALILR